MMEKSLSSLRHSRAISSKEKRMRQLAILSHLIEMAGYRPNEFIHALGLAETIKNVRKYKWSPEKGAANVVKLLQTGVINSG